MKQVNHSSFVVPSEETCNAIVSPLIRRIDFDRDTKEVRVVIVVESKPVESPRIRNVWTLVIRGPVPVAPVGTDSCFLLVTTGETNASLYSRSEGASYCLRQSLLRVVDFFPGFKIGKHSAPVSAKALANVPETPNVAADPPAQAREAHRSGFGFRGLGRIHVPGPTAT